MAIRPLIQADLRLLPFRGSDVVRRGLLSWTALRGSAWRRLLPHMYVAADVPLDHRVWCYPASLAVADYGAVSGLSAAAMWGIDVVDPGCGQAEVTVPNRIRRAGCEHVLGGVRLTTPERTAFDLGRLDLAYEEWKIGIEYDGDHHRDPATFRRDLVRLNALRVAGWTILRFTASDVYRNPERIVAQVRAVLPR